MTRPVGRAEVSSPPRPSSYRGHHRGGGGSFPRGLHRPKLALWQEVPLVIVIALGLSVLVRGVLLEPFYIPSGSMEQTLLVGDRVLVNKLVYDVRDPRRGEVVVFRGTTSWAPEQREQRSGGTLATVSRVAGRLVGLGDPGEKDFVKRVIGLGGDVVACCDASGRFTVNGRGLTEPYVYDNNPLEQRSFGPVTVPDGRIFVMGDHRGNSKDSRAYLDDGASGTIPLRNVIGRAFVTVWPVSRWDTLPAPTSFSDVGRPPTAATLTPDSPSYSREQRGATVADGPYAPLPRNAVAVNRLTHRGRRIRG